MLNPWTLKQPTNSGATKGKRGFTTASTSQQSFQFVVAGGNVPNGVTTFPQNGLPSQARIGIYHNVRPVMPFNMPGNYMDFPNLENTSNTMKETSRFPKGPPLCLEAVRLMKQSKSQRNFIKDDSGKVMFDCGDMHPSSTLCQFCDGRKGSWATRPRSDVPTKSELDFLRYQDNIINSATSIIQILGSDM